MNSNMTQLSLRPDLDAAEKLIDIVKMFSDKNPIRKVPINYNKFHATIQN